MLPMGVQRFFHWCKWATGMVYDDSLSEYEFMDRVARKLNEVIEQDNESREGIERLYDLVMGYLDQVDALTKQYADFESGAFLEEYLETMYQYVDENIADMAARVVKMISFGLDEEGHVVAYIPATWDFLKFHTGVNYTDPDTYGHLIIEY